MWYEVLLHVNNISKLWQSVQVNLKVAIDTLLSFCSWIQEFHNTGLDNSVAQARLFVEKSISKLSLNLKKKEQPGKKRMFGYEHIDKPIKSFEMQYRVNFFNTMIDAIIVDTECRFKALNEQFDFNYDISYLNSISKEDLLKYCNDLFTMLREGENSDIQLFELYEELQLLKTNSLDYQRRETTHSVHFRK
ncbi:zinc finger MYM-type protein 1 [Trichonephila clavipes]|nr:zinc finger MYM-type protein 1 [Trichonephila clavipes]